MRQQAREPARRQPLLSGVLPARQQHPDLRLTQLLPAVTEHPGETTPGSSSIEDDELLARQAASS